MLNIVRGLALDLGRPDIEVRVIRRRSL